MENSNQNKNKKIINVSDIIAWTYCPRKLFMTRVLGLKTRPNKPMIIGKLKHQIIEFFSKKEEKLVSNIDKDYDKIELVLIYDDFIKNIAENIFNENKDLIEAFKIDTREVLKIVQKDFAGDLKIRIEAIKEALSKGFLKEDIWKNLDKLYISELRLESEAFGLRGRVDRVEISKKDNSIIPYELKTRDDKIFYSDEIQLAAYAMMLEDYYKTIIKYGFVESGARKEQIDITQEHKDNVLKLADEIRDMYNNLPPPILSHFAKCAKCDFSEDCPKI